MELNETGLLKRQDSQLESEEQSKDLVKDAMSPHRASLSCTTRQSGVMFGTHSQRWNWPQLNAHWLNLTYQGTIKSSCKLETRWNLHCTAAQGPHHMDSNRRFLPANLRSSTTVCIVEVKLFPQRILPDFVKTDPKHMCTMLLTSAKQWSASHRISHRNACMHLQTQHQSPGDLVSMQAPGEQNEGAGIMRSSSRYLIAEVGQTNLCADSLTCPTYQTSHIAGLFHSFENNPLLQRYISKLGKSSEAQLGIKANQTTLHSMWKADQNLSEVRNQWGRENGWKWTIRQYVKKKPWAKGYKRMQKALNALLAASPALWGTQWAEGQDLHSPVLLCSRTASSRQVELKSW